MTAMTAATIDQLSDGRMLLGIGSSGPQVAEGWHGQRFAQQLQRTREYVAVVRMALARERVEFHGETLELPLPDGPGKALKLTIAPVQERMPIYIAAIGPKNTELTAEIADGWIPTLFSPEHVSEFRPLLEAGFARGGGRLRRVRHRADGQRHGLRRPRARARRDAPLHRALRRRHGLAQAELLQRAGAALRVRGGGEQVQSLYLEGRKDEAAAALPGELIDAVSLVGPRDVVRARLALYREAGVGTLMISPWRGRSRNASRSCASWPSSRGVIERAPARERRAGARGARPGVRRDLPRLAPGRLDAAGGRKRLGGALRRSGTLVGRRRGRRRASSASARSVPRTRSRSRGASAAAAAGRARRRRVRRSRRAGGRGSRGGCWR